MEKVKAIEVAPESCDFSFYFDGDGFSRRCGSLEYEIYILDCKGNCNYNVDEYEEIKRKAHGISESFYDIQNKNGYASYKEAMEDYDIPYTSRRCGQLKKWELLEGLDMPDSIADFLTIVTGKKWRTSCTNGYSQGDSCLIVFCSETYEESAMSEIGKMWLGCGSEFIIDDCGGFFVTDTIRWREGKTLRNALAERYGCKPDEMEIYLYEGSHRVDDYRIMED